VALDANLPLTNVVTMQEHMRLLLAPARLLALLSSALGLLALLLAAIGLYGVMAYVVGSRTREIGIRMALGAQTSGVRRLVIGQGLRLALIGIALGLIAAFGLTRVLQSVLYGVSAKRSFDVHWRRSPVAGGGVARLLRPGAARDQKSIRWWRCGTNE
jgi:ABC-type antimicrobial peptide transport system permease subunit